jgi:opacity protein-like surface antigen
MKKSISSASLLLLSSLATTTQADVEKGVYLGLDMNTSLSGTATAEYERSNIENETDIDTTGAGIFIGYRSSRNNRVQLSFTSFDVEYEGGTTEEVTGMDFDWQFVYGDKTVQPYWGLGFGLYTYEDTSDLFVSDEDLKGVSFQLAAGAKFDLHEHFELDASYHIKSIAWQDIVVINGFTSETLSLSHTFSYLNFGAAIKF